MTVYSPPAHRMTPAELRAALAFKREPIEPRVSPWVRSAIAGTLPAPTLAPTQAEIDLELFERYRFAFRVR